MTTNNEFFLSDDSAHQSDRIRIGSARLSTAGVMLAMND
jgi:hypothetical protein